MHNVYGCDVLSLTPHQTVMHVIQYTHRQLLKINCGGKSKAKE